MRCLETRTTADGFKRRRYEDVRGARSTTVEIPVALFNELVSIAREADKLGVAAAALQLIRKRSSESTSTGVDLQGAWRVI